MTVKTMMKYYKQRNASQEFIIGFTYNKTIYFIQMKHIPLKYLKVEEASRKQGQSLRLRLNKEQCAKLIKKAQSLGIENILIDNKYNKGEMFEKHITEHFKKEWKKDNIPYWKQGDINLNGIEIQIKYNGATLTTTKQIKKGR